MIYIEDIVEHIGNGFYSPTPNFLNHTEYSILISLAEQTYTAQALTEKQAMLAIRILDRHKNNIRPAISNIDNMLASPKWRYPFRDISTIRRVGIDDENNIIVEFPYTSTIVEMFKTRNSLVHDLHKGIWDPQSRLWKFSLTEKNILWIIDTLKNNDFQISEDLQTLYNDANNVRENIEDYLPMLSIKDGHYVIVNGYSSIPQPNTTVLAEALFHARNYGIVNWDESVDLQIRNDLNPFTKTILESTTKNRPWFNSDEIELTDAFSDLIKFGGPVLVIVPGGSEYQLVKKWTNFALENGILANEISTMFRLPNNQAEFNLFIKENRLNNPVNDCTKIVFVSTKITKPLIKSGIKFSSIVDLGYYNYLHFSMQTMVDNACNLVYYSIKGPNKVKWLPHEL